MLAVKTRERLPQFPDVQSFKEPGVEWIDGAYRGIAVPKSAEAVRTQVSDMMEVLDTDPDVRRKMVEGGFEATDVACDRIRAFMRERLADDMNTARQLGMIR